MTTMNRILCAALLSAFAVPAFAGDVGVSISIGQPGFYGQINIGNLPPPPVIYAQPIVAVQSPVYISAGPIYLHVPPGYEKHWRRHCAQYDACGRPVYFVRDDWYYHEYVPRYRHEHDGDDDDDQGHGHEHGHRHGHGHGHHKDHDRDEG